jgi:hypothetical protein
MKDPMEPCGEMVWTGSSEPMNYVAFRDWLYSYCTNTIKDNNACTSLASTSRKKDDSTMKYTLVIGM